MRWRRRPIHWSSCRAPRPRQGPGDDGASGHAVPRGADRDGGDASLLQRVGDAVSKDGGTIQSSQVDVTGTQAKDGFVGLTVSCGMEQPALQKLLYDLEVGMPFLFVDQLDVWVPQMTAAAGGTGKVRVVLGVWAVAGSK